MLFWLLALFPLLTSCATWHSMLTGGSAGGAPAVSLTPPPPETPAPIVLAATSSPSAAPAPARPALAGDPYRDALADAYRSFKTLTEGKNADYIPILAKVDPALYGIVLVTVDGAVYEIGAARDEFSIQSVSKPFTAARAIETDGADAVDNRIGVNATGQKFNSIFAIDLAKNLPADKDHVHPAGNPLVNAGAIADGRHGCGGARHGPVGGAARQPRGVRWPRLTVNEEVYRSEAETNTHNRAIVQLLKDYEVIQGDPMQALDLYTRQCSVSVSARDLAIMGATLANGGRNPLTRVQVVSPDDGGQGAGHHLDGGLVRNHRRVALPRRRAGQERRGRRHRRRRTGQVRDRNVRAAARSGGQQRARPARDRRDREEAGRQRVCVEARGPSAPDQRGGVLPQGPQRSPVPGEHTPMSETPDAKSDRDATSSLTARSSP